MEIKRDRYLQALIDRRDNGLIKVITGARRCGKTYLLFHLFKNYLQEQGVESSRIVEVPLDVEEFEDLRDASALSRYLKEAMPKGQDSYYLFLDEVQFAITEDEFAGKKAPRIYGVLNSLLRRGDVDVYVTGSNSKLLAKDVLTEFRGRGDEVRIRPLAFAEFMQAFEGDVYQGWAEYTAYGGMPLVLAMRTDEQKTRYLERLFTETYMKDIAARYKLRKPQEMEQLIDVLASSIGALTNPSKLEATFKSVLHSKMTSNTIAKYIGYLEDAFLVDEAKRFDVKGRRYIGSPRKYYFEDVGLRNARLQFRQIEPAHLMENVIYNELRYRGYSVDVGSVEKRVWSRAGAETRKQLEVDFVANMGSRRYYIQSALHMPDAAKEEQEKASLRELTDGFKRIVITGDVVRPVYDDTGIQTIGLFDFLLDRVAWE